MFWFGFLDLSWNSCRPFIFKADFLFCALAHLEFALCVTWYHGSSFNFHRTPASLWAYYLSSKELLQTFLSLALTGYWVCCHLHYYVLPLAWMRNFKIKLTLGSWIKSFTVLVTYIQNRSLPSREGNFCRPLEPEWNMWKVLEKFLYIFWSSEGKCCWLMTLWLAYYQHRLALWCLFEYPGRSKSLCIYSQHGLRACVGWSCFLA